MWDIQPCKGMLVWFFLPLACGLSVCGLGLGPLSPGSCVGKG